MHTTDLVPLLMYFMMFQVFSEWFDTSSLTDCSHLLQEVLSQGLRS